MSDSIADLGGLKLIDLSVPLEDAAVSEPARAGAVRWRERGGVTRASRRLR